MLMLKLFSSATNTHHIFFFISLNMIITVRVQVLISSVKPIQIKKFCIKLLHIWPKSSDFCQHLQNMYYFCENTQIDVSILRANVFFAQVPKFPVLFHFALIFGLTHAKRSLSFVPQFSNKKHTCLFRAWLGQSNKK